MNSIVAFLLLCIPARIGIAVASQYIPDKYLQAYGIMLLLIGLVNKFLKSFIQVVSHQLKVNINYYNLLEITKEKEKNINMYYMVLMQI